MALNNIGISGPFALPPASFDIATLRTALETAIPGSDAGRAARVATALQAAKAQAGDTPVLGDLDLSPTSIRIGVNSTVLIGGATDGSSLTISAEPDGLALSSAQRVLSGVATHLGEYEFVITETLAGAIGSPKLNRLVLTTTQAPVGPNIFNTPGTSTISGTQLDGFTAPANDLDTRFTSLGV